MSLELETFTIHTQCSLMAATKTETTRGPTSSMATARDVTAKRHRMGVCVCVGGGGGGGGGGG